MKQANVTQYVHLHNLKKYFTFSCHWSATFSMYLLPESMSVPLKTI